MPDVHASPFAGRWYSSERSELSAQVNELIRESERRIPFVRGGGAGFVVPHAAPLYSGGVAAAVYRHVAAARPRRIVMIGFPHRGGLPGIGVPSVHSISTPLGSTRIDVDAAAQITASVPFRWVDEAAVCDHSVEIQLPFLQTLLPEARMLPLYVGPLSRSERFAAASRLRELADGETVFIASSDFTHYGRDFDYVPFALDGSTPDRLKELDHEIMASASGIDPSLFLDDVQRAQWTVCGYQPIALLLEMLRGFEGDEVFQETIDYQTSGDITSDYGHCVSYSGLGYFPERAFRLNADSCRRLLQLAREALENSRTPAEVGADPDLQQNRGVFVTIYQHGELRGCIGSCREPDTLARSVPQLTLSAAHEDQRFAPLDGSAPVDVQISVLSPFKRIQNRSDFIAREHGGYLEFGEHAGLLLPQVAKEHHLDGPGFLEALARKAGVSPRVYGDPASRLFVFRAQVFGERGATAPSVSMQ
jgi:MEMO1 family protein